MDKFGILNFLTSLNKFYEDNKQQKANVGDTDVNNNANKPDEEQNNSKNNSSYVQSPDYSQNKPKNVNKPDNNKPDNTSKNNSAKPNSPENDKKNLNGTDIKNNKHLSLPLLLVMQNHNEFIKRVNKNQNNKNLPDKSE